MKGRLLALLLPLPAMAQQAPQCWLPYSGFEERVPHLDLDRCPGNDPAPAEGFCRIAIQGNEVFVYVFRHDAGAGMPCLVRVDRAYVNDFLRHNTPTYRAP